MLPTRGGPSQKTLPEAYLSRRWAKARGVLRRRQPVFFVTRLFPKGRYHVSAEWPTSRPAPELPAHSDIPTPCAASIPSLPCGVVALSFVRRAARHAHSVHRFAYMRTTVGRPVEPSRRHCGPEPEMTPFSSRNAPCSSRIFLDCQRTPRLASHAPRHSTECGRTSAGREPWCARRQRWRKWRASGQRQMERMPGHTSSARVVRTVAPARSAHAGATAMLNSREIVCIYVRGPGRSSQP
jgi:hypothetical protein